MKQFKRQKLSTKINIKQRFPKYHDSKNSYTLTIAPVDVKPEKTSFRNKKLSLQKYYRYLQYK